MCSTWLMVPRVKIIAGRSGLLCQFDSQCSFCSAGRGGSRKRRRGKLPLAATKKDRIRSLERKPEPELALPSIDLGNVDFKTVGDVVESRLTQAQEFVYKFWRGEDKGPRPERTALNMDKTWWFWNIMLMSMPGIMIGLYCEFKAKPEMHELLGKLNEEQRARILGDTLEAEDELFEMGDRNVQQLQESTNAEIATDDENLTLLALKQRLDALESQLIKRDKQLDHLRRYQLERTQQSGVQNRIEDKMISEWKSQGSSKSVEAVETTDDDSYMSLTERMKVAVMHGLAENLEAKRKALMTYGVRGLEYGRRILSGESEELKTPTETETNSDKTNSTPVATTDSNEQVAKAVNDVSAHVTRAAEVVSASVSSNDPKEMARAAKEASNAATEASRAAHAAADALPKSNDNEPGFLLQQWNKLFRKGDTKGEPSGKNAKES